MSESFNLENSGAFKDRTLKPITFEPLARDPAGALAPAPDLGITDARLVSGWQLWRGIHNLKIRLTAPDLISASAAHPDICDLFPKGAELFEVELEIKVADNPAPVRVKLRRPCRCGFSREEFAEAIEAYLRRRGFRA